MVGGSVLRDRGPVVGLEGQQGTKSAARGSYVVDEGIGEDVIVGGNLREGQRLLLGLGPWRHCLFSGRPRGKQRALRGLRHNTIRTPNNRTGSTQRDGMRLYQWKEWTKGLSVGAPSIAPETVSASRGTLVGTSPALRLAMRWGVAGSRECAGEGSRRHTLAESQ